MATLQGAFHHQFHPPENCRELLQSVPETHCSTTRFPIHPYYHGTELNTEVQPTAQLPALGNGRGTIRISEDALDDYLGSCEVVKEESCARLANPVKLKHIRL